MSEARGRTVQYHPETLDEAYASRAQWNPEPWQADAWVSTYTAIAEGALAHVSGDVERVTGRAADVPAGGVRRELILGGGGAHRVRPTARAARSAKPST